MTQADPMIKRVRKLAGTGYEWLHDVADRLEKLQMPHAQVLKLADVGDGGAVDAQALINALCKKVEAQKKEITRLTREIREESTASAVEERWKNAQGDEYGTY